MTTVTFEAHPCKAPKDPVFVEGLPGVGNVGKLACDHLASVLDAKPWFEIYSRDFPPQVTVKADGTVRMAAARLSVAHGAADGRDVVIMTGDFQPLSPGGQHDLVEGVLDKLEEVGCKQLVTTGGYGLGTSVDEPGVLGAATDKKMVKRLEDLEVHFEEDEPGAGIIGASGLFLGLCMRRKMSGACLMGETSGYLVDPKAARAVLTIIGKLLGIKDLEPERLDEKAEELDRIARQLQESEASLRNEGDLHYIG